MGKGQIKQAQAKVVKEEFEKLCQLQCTRDEIAGFFGISTSALIDWCHNTYGVDFNTTFKQKSDGGKVSLRRKQWTTAIETGNPTLLIWLGKQYLNQSDKVENAINEKIEIVNDITPTIEENEQTKYPEADR